MKRIYHKSLWGAVLRNQDYPRDFKIVWYSIYNKFFHCKILLWKMFKWNTVQLLLYKIGLLHIFWNNLTSNPKLLADETLLFSTVTDPNAINHNFHNINTWALQWKMNFNPDTSKQAPEVIFSRKVKVIAHHQLVFNKNPVHETTTQNHLGIFLNFKLNFLEHFENIFNKANKTIELPWKL